MQSTPPLWAPLPVTGRALTDPDSLQRLGQKEGLLLVVVAGGAAVHVLDPREAGFCPAVFLQGLNTRKAALAWGAVGVPQDSCLHSGPALTNRQAPDPPTGDPWHLWQLKSAGGPAPGWRGLLPRAESRQRAVPRALHPV